MPQLRSETPPTPDISPQHSLLVELTREESAKARKFWDDAANVPELSPLAFTCWGLQLHSKDIKSLHHGIWVNDNIVNCFSRFLMASFDAVAIPNVEATIGTSTKRAVDGNEGKLNLNNVAFIFVPMCDGFHWRLGIAAAISETMYLYDPEGVKRCNERILDNLHRWLKTVVDKSEADSNFFTIAIQTNQTVIENGARAHEETRSSSNVGGQSAAP